MFNQKELKDKTITELKKIADSNKINYADKAKKEDLIKLILKSQANTSSKPIVIKSVKKEIKVKPAKSKSVDIKIKPAKEKAADIKKDTKKQNNISISNGKLPDNYGKDKLILLIVNPYKGYAYWEFSDKSKNTHGLQNKDIIKYLRLYDITEKGEINKSTDYQDIRLNNDSSSWYIDFNKPNRKYIAQIGYIKSGKFIPVISSNSVVVPRDEVSHEIDKKWMINNEKYKLILEASGANVLFKHDGSQELMKFLAGNIEESISSGKIE